MRKYFSDSSEHPAFIEALAEVRRIGAHEGWCYQHVQAILLGLGSLALGIVVFLVWTYRTGRWPFGKAGPGSAEEEPLPRQVRADGGSDG